MSVQMWAAGAVVIDVIGWVLQVLVLLIGLVLIVAGVAALVSILREIRAYDKEQINGAA